MYHGQTIGVVVPALNEEDAIGEVVRSLFAVTDNDQSPIVDTVVVGDNGSTDRTSTIASDNGAVVVQSERMGYGSACLAALQHYESFPHQIIVFIDGDHAFEASEISRLLDPIKDHDLVLGSRSLGTAEPKSMNRIQKFGNRFATGLIRLLWKRKMSDLGPFRAIRFDRLKELNMQDPAYGWTVEMQIKAIQKGQKITEVPVTTRVPISKSKISGTLRGITDAGAGILGTIAKLWLQEQKNKK